MSVWQGTPGPWKAHWEKYDKDIVIYPLGSRYPLAKVDYDDVDQDTAEIDAKGIAATPQLVDALADELRRVRSSYDNTPAAQAYFKRNHAASLAALKAAGVEL